MSFTLAMNSRKRMTMKLKRPNPLFEQWLSEWRDQAKESGSKMEHCFSTALKSLQKYPLPLESGKDCKILHGFGDKLCKMLDDKLKKQKPDQLDSTKIGVDSMPVIEPRAKKPKKVVQRGNSPLKKRNTDHKLEAIKIGGSSRSVDVPTTSPGKEYVPQYGSGAFAILITLYEGCAESNSTHMTKAEIIKKGQHLCSASFTKPQPNTRYTAWSSMKTLLDKKFITKHSNPAKFSLTAEGTVLADKLYVQYTIEKFKENVEAEEAPEMPQSSIPQPVNISNGLCKSAVNVQKPSSSSSSLSKHNSENSVASSTQSSSNYESFVMQPGAFKIILLVDTQEVNSKSNADNDPLCRELSSRQIHHEVRNLKVGDYLWICRDNTSGCEVVLPYIIERKRMDDLGSSIKDGRFHEQKFRLKQCGLNNLIYLVESYGRNENVGLPVATLYQAAINTAVQDGFVIKFTQDLRETVDYLTCLTRLIVRHYKDKCISNCSPEDFKQVAIEDDLIFLMNFNQFNKSASKTKQFKVKDMFVRHLLQIKGLSVEKALAIVDKYPTPMRLKLAYGNLAEEQKEKLIAAVPYGALGKKVGPVLSRTVYQFFCRTRF